jgi:hypothetical protein
VYVAQFLDGLAIRPDVEIVEPTLPDTIVDDVVRRYIPMVVPHVSQNPRDMGHPAVLNDVVGQPISIIVSHVSQNPRDMGHPCEV